MPAWHFRHIFSTPFYLFGTSTVQGTARLPSCRTGQVPAWTGLRKDPTRIAKGEFQVCYWPKPGEKKQCAAPAQHQMGTVCLFGFVRWLSKTGLIIFSPSLTHVQEFPLEVCFVMPSAKSVKHYGSFLNIPAARWQEHYCDKAKPA